MREPSAVVDWLLGSDPSIRWQVLRDLLGRPESVWSAERALVETEGWGAWLLALEDDDGQWAGGAHFPAHFAWPGPETFQGPGDAVAHVRSRRRGDGRWDLDWRPEGRTWFHLDDGPGQPSRWITLDALRVLAWWDAQVTP
jgi:hypothetical protein